MPHTTAEMVSSYWNSIGDSPERFAREGHILGRDGRPVTYGRDGQPLRYGPTGPGFPSPTDTYVPSFDASGRLIIGYSRNATTFPFPRYWQYISSPRNRGYFLKLSPQEAGRVVTPQEYEWHGGAVRPFHADGVEQFNYIEFTTHRYDYGFTLDYMGSQQADWPIVDQHSQIHAAKMMTNREVRGIAAWNVASAWQTTADPDLSANHTATATALVGGQLDLGTSAAPYIKKAMDKIAVLIGLDTLGVVPQSALMFVINPNQARLWAESSEIHEYIKGSYWAQQEILQGLQPNNKYGLPSSIYGYQIIVDDTVQITSRKGATLTKVWAFPDQVVLCVSRVGGLQGVFGGPSFSTLTFFYYVDESTLERFDDPKNRLTEGHVVENGIEVVTSPLSGYFLTASTSVAS
jgi:hypothetical protein